MGRSGKLAKAAVGENGETVWINNGGIAVLSGDLMLNHLFQAPAVLAISGGAKLTRGCAWPLSSWRTMRRLP